MPEEIEQLLGKLQEGETQSEGAFQLDPVRLASEMSVVLKQQPATWLMKALQFCLSTEPPVLDIQIQSNTLVMEFIPNRWNPGLLEIRDGFSFLSPDLSQSRSARHFRHLLWLLGARPDLDWSLEQRAADLIALSFKKTKHPSQLAPKPAFFTFELECPTISWYWPEWAVTRDALCCNLSTVSMNGRDLTLGRFAAVTRGWPARASRNHTLWDEIATGVGTVGPLAPARSGFPATSPAHPRPQQTGSTLRVRLITSMESQAGRWFYFVQDGFVVDRIAAAPMEGIQALIDASDIKVDASFFRAVRDQAWKDKVQWAYQRCLDAVKHWQSYMTPKFPPPSMLNPNTSLHGTIEKRLNGPLIELDWNAL